MRAEDVRQENLEQEEQLGADGMTESTTQAEEKENMAEEAEETQPPLSEEERLRSELEKLNDTYLRLVAEYDNYRKRTLKEKSELIKSGGKKTLLELLPVIDDLELALQNIASAENLEGVKEGVNLIYSKFVDYLSRQGVKAIETADAPFDDNLHEAIAVVPAPAEEQKGRIIDCIKRGYTLHDDVIRHASVVVGQ